MSLSGVLPDSMCLRFLLIVLRLWCVKEYVCIGYCVVVVV